MKGVEGSSLFDIDEPRVRHVEVKTENVEKTNTAEIMQEYIFENGADIFYFFTNGNLGKIEIIRVLTTESIF